MSSIFGAILEFWRKMTRGAAELLVATRFLGVILVTVLVADERGDPVDTSLSVRPRNGV